MKIIPIWQCCGALGGCIPWAVFMAEGFQPTNDTTKPFIYLYSIKGQLGDEARVKAIVPHLPSLPVNSIAAINIDDFLNDSLLVEWEDLLHTLRSIRREQNEE